MFSLVSFSHHHICGDVDDGVKKWRFVGIYGWAKEEEKHHTWTLMRHLCGESTRPILLGDDFNEILSYEEKEGGADRVRRKMNNFRDTMNDLSLRDLGYNGLWYTWERGNTPSTCIRERLDRFVCTSSWVALYPNSRVNHSVRYKSDHLAICLRPNKQRKPTGKQCRFFFETSWLLDPTCEATVRATWSESAGDSIPSRLASMAQNLKRWGDQKVGNIGKSIKRAEEELGKVQQQPINSENCTARIAIIEKQLDDLLAKHEAHWFLRSRVSEVHDGDRNTKYFHHKASQRKKRNYVKGLFDSSGTWCEDINDVESIFTDYFSSIFTSTNPSDMQLHDVLCFVDPVVSEDCNQWLLRPFSKEEIFAALSQMHPSKATRPDGMHAISYKKFWHIIGDDVTDFVTIILHGSRSPSCVNHTNIALIPKVKTPTHAADFRPIALCNVLYKLVSKAIIIRLKDYLPSLVSKNQSAFVPGRLITDNALIAMEIFHSMKH